MMSTAPDATSASDPDSGCVSLPCIISTLSIIILMYFTILDAVCVILFSIEYNDGERAMADDHFKGFTIAMISLSSMSLCIDMCIICGTITIYSSGEQDTVVSRSRLMLVLVYHRILNGIIAGVFIYNIEMHSHTLQALLMVEFISDMAFIGLVVCLGITTCCGLCYLKAKEAL